VPNVAVILGEGGSGGAVALATANKVLMLEHAIYSVISPEGAASILWRDTTKAQDAATNMKITAADLSQFGIIDAIVTEPVGGAHRDPAAAIAATGEAVSSGRPTATASGASAATSSSPSDVDWNSAKPAESLPCFIPRGVNCGRSDSAIESLKIIGAFGHNFTLRSR
jgi:hypothetical protein